jgi:hypothetical protein
LIFSNCEVHPIPSASHTWRGEKYALQSSAVETPRPFSAHKGHGGIFAFHNVVNQLSFLHQNRLVYLELVI